MHACANVISESVPTETGALSEVSYLVYMLNVYCICAHSGSLSRYQHAPQIRAALLAVTANDVAALVKYY